MLKQKLSKILTFILLLIGMAIFQTIPLMFFNININDFSNPMKALYMFLCDLGFIIILIFLYKESLIEDFKIFKKNFKKNLKPTIKFYLIGLIIMIISKTIIDNLIPGITANNNDSIINSINLYPLYKTFNIIIYAPLIEELIFRKSIKDSIFIFKNNKITKYIFIIISSLIFAFLHVINAQKTIDYLYIIPYLGISISFAIIYLKTNNIFNSITIHSIHNIITILIYFIFYMTVRF